MTDLTKEQWTLIETELSGMFGAVHLRCDGFEVKAEIMTVAKFRQAIVVYVNGWIKGEWMKGEAEEAKKFHRPVKRYLYSTKERDEASRKAKSRSLAHSGLRDFYARKAEASITTWAAYWTNPKLFCRNLRKTCSNIEIIKIGYSV